MKEYSPKPDDQETFQYYASGKIKERSYTRNGEPSNGWSRTVYYEEGRIKLESCYSHSLLIEEIEYDVDGNVQSHKIYSHAQKKLIDRPISKPMPRPNVVTGCAHMGFFYMYLPAIAEYIGADYDESSLEKAYNDHLEDASTYEFTDKDYEEKEYPWKLPGKKMNFGLWFEKGEMLYQWHLWAKSEEQYEEAREFMERLRADFREKLNREDGKAQ